MTPSVCVRCSSVRHAGEGFFNHPAIGGKVCLRCVTDDDMEILFPGRRERIRRHREALDFVSRRHREGACDAPCREFNIACPLHSGEEE